MDWNGLLNFQEDPQRNMLMQVGLGLLAGNQSGNAAAGAMRGFQSAQELINAQQRQKVMEEEMAMRKQDQEWRRAEAERAANEPYKVGNVLLDKKTLKPLYQAPEVRQLGLNARIVMNPKTGKAELAQPSTTGEWVFSGLEPTKDEIDAERHSIEIQKLIDAGVIPPTFRGVTPAIAPAPYNIQLAPGTSPEEAAKIQAVAAADFATNGASLHPKAQREIAQRQAEAKILTPMQQADLDKASREKEQEAQKQKDRARLSIGKADTVISKVNEALGMVGSSTSGPVGAMLQDSPVRSSIVDFLGGGNAYDLNKAVQTIKANIGFAELQAMREASPTGGALGQVAVQELENLQSTIASLDQGQSPSKLRENLLKVKEHFQNWKDAVSGNLPQGAQMEQQSKQRTRKDILEQYGVTK